MKRSEINGIIQMAIEFIESMHYKLPPFATWTAKNWKMKGAEYEEIRDNMLGWDITDFGSGDFSKIGLLIFTIRNGNLTNSKYPKSYCEKLLIVDEGQLLPLHFHWKKMEDIINRGGGNLMVKIYNSTDQGKLADTPVHVTLDGKRYTAKPGEILKLHPGESITLFPGQYHEFWGEEGTGKVLLGEVSTVNDDRSDNRFYDHSGRFPRIEEDEEPVYLLFNDYEKYWLG